MAKILCIDWGSKRWGIAVAELNFGISFPRPILEGKNKLSDLLKILEEEECRTVVLGYPLNMDGSKGKNCEPIELLQKDLESRGFEVNLWDERLSSEEASRELSELGVNTKKQRGILDSRAAAKILDSFLKSKK